MKHSHKKSFDWYSMQQRYSIRKYYFGAVSVLLGTALVLGAAASVQTVQAEENKQEPQLFTPNLKTIQNPCLSLDPGWFLF
ncbi:YSIRK-type signal peptide-containing protein, partial [Streptococcus pneumoniae]